MLSDAIFYLFMFCGFGVLLFISGWSMSRIYRSLVLEVLNESIVIPWPNN